MREIKFRVWATLTKPKMIYLKDGALSDLNSVEDEWEVMQFAGLKDKNGKEIYEGDVIMIYAFSKTLIAKVEFVDCCFRTDVLSTYDGKEPLAYWINNNTKVEIIGNIHENPELREG